MHKRGYVVAHGSQLLKFFYEQLALVERPTLLDIGASTGSFSLLGILHAGLSVIAFEPNPISRKILSQNVELNGLSSRVKIMPCAIADYDGSGTLSYQTSQSGFGTLGTPKRFTPDREVTTEVHQIDSLFLPRSDFVKMDIEGAELLALRGGEKYFRTYMPKMLLEYKKDAIRQFGYDREEIKKLLTSWGYTGFKYFFGWGKGDLWVTK